MATTDIPDFDGLRRALQNPLPPGRANAAASKPSVMATEDKAVLDAIAASLVTIDGRVDGLEALIALTNGYVDGLEGLLTTQAGYLDGVETAIASTNTKLDSIIAADAAATLGAGLPFKNLDVDETEDAVKASAGYLFSLHAMNLSNAKRYLKIYNATVASVTVGTTVPVHTYLIPTMGDTNGAGFTINLGATGEYYDTAITIAATTGFADNDTGAPGANEIIVNGTYV